MDDISNQMAEASDLPVLAEAPSIEPAFSEDETTVTLFTQSEDEVGDEAETVLA